MEENKTVAAMQTKKKKEAMPFSDDAVASRKKRQEIIDGKYRMKRRKVVVCAPIV